MARSILAVVVGFVLIGILAFGADAVMRMVMPDAFPADGQMITDTTYIVASLVYVAVFAILGSYVTARLAPNRPLFHALVLGVLGLLFQAAALTQVWGTLPAWYNILQLALVLPYAYIGGKLRERELARGPAGHPAAA